MKVGEHQISSTQSVCPCTLKPSGSDPPLLLLSSLRNETQKPNPRTRRGLLETSWLQFSSLLGHGNPQERETQLFLFFFLGKSHTNFKITTISEATYKHVFIVSSLRSAKITIPLHTRVAGRSHFLRRSRFSSKSPPNKPDTTKV